MPSGIGLPEVIIVLVIALLFFGPKRLPDLGRSLGTGLREFKDSITGNSKDDDEPSEIAAAGADEQAKPKPEPHDDAVSSSRG
jgi:sec-independent protein translocase protein TatA